jgi:hypothetical protein
MNSPRYYLNSVAALSLITDAVAADDDKYGNDIVQRQLLTVHFRDEQQLALGQIRGHNVIHIRRSRLTATRNERYAASERMYARTSDCAVWLAARWAARLVPWWTERCVVGGAVDGAVEASVPVTVSGAFSNVP